ncbi:hypothetical protein K431DRAFT_311375 [Polychaeton citri CBS 116435]|uniref:CT20-domain-containing protein n=1 Tax=Polychaeton citri CBS 116435 TaxID=1314669 RepID=A0A9P4QC31_9PEZI|nr:hypothetical protein K431DRAFT_311375 [Polychaeton citri CBS 116435]
MPPKKKARVSRTASPTPASPSPTTKADDPVKSDLWTDEEETGLFKGLITWKPTGIHKHFRLIQLRQYLIENGYVDPRNEHTRPPGIWRKLNELYHLDALDQREDARQLSDLELGSDEQEDDDEDDDDDDVYSLAANKIHNQDFDLDGKGGDSEFMRMMWDRRIASNKARRDESPPNLPEINMADDPPVRFTPTVSVEPSELAATPSSRTGRAARGARGRGRGGTVPSVAAMRRSTRRAESAAESAQSAQSQEEEEDGDESSSEGGEEDDDNESKESTPAPRRSGRSKQRGGANTKGRGRGRGR